LNISTDIRGLYTPIQPTVRQSADCVTYQEFLPGDNLRHFIYCYWQLKTSQTLSEQFNYRVVADGCIDVFLELNKPEDNYVMGFCKKYTEFPLADSFNYIGIRFLPTMFPQLFNINASDLSNRFESLSSVVPDLSDFIKDHINSSHPMEDIKNLFDAYFNECILSVRFNDDKRLYGAIELILKNYGVVDIEKLDTGISSRQLRRLFEYYIGDSAKIFSKIVRFQNILKAKPSRQSLQQNKLFFESSYFDQAHFIKDFKNFYGVTPGKVFGRL
jgi:AraC-like DNA-binding protein